MNSIAKAVMATALLGASGVASATNFYLCPEAGTGCTDVFEQMTVFLDATSNYTDNNSDGGISVGDTVLDTGSGNVTGFQPTTFGTDDQGYGPSNWMLNLEFSNLVQVVTVVDDSSGNADGIGQVGETVGVGSYILSGTIDIYYQDANYNELVAQLVITSSTGTIGDIVISGLIDFSNVTDTALAAGLFFMDDGTSWYDLWNATDPVEIAARFDTNIDQLLVQDGENGYDFLRETDLDGSLRVTVPSPAPLALMGLGLAAVGFARRRKA